MKEMLKMMIVLSLICGISGFALASLKEATSQRIVEQELTYVQAPAILHVLVEHDNDPIKDRKTFEVNGEEIMVFPAMRSGKLVGVAFETAGKGYGGNIGVMVGFELEQQALSGIGITTMKETPGLGTRVAEHGFTAQFKGHALTGIDLKANGGDIDGVAGATISSTGTSFAVRRAVEMYEKIKTEFETAWS